MLGLRLDEPLSLEGLERGRSTEAALERMVQGGLAVVGAGAAPGSRRSSLTAPWSLPRRRGHGRAPRRSARERRALRAAHVHTRDADRPFVPADFEPPLGSCRRSSRSSRSGRSTTRPTTQRGRRRIEHIRATPGFGGGRGRTR